LVGEGTCVICEAEIDALSWQTSGIQAVAIGGISFNWRQADIIRQLPASKYVIAGDNDKAGDRFNETVVRTLQNDVRLAVLRWQDDRHKDANDVLRNNGADGLRELTKQVLRVPVLYKL
jgi:DNA primase